MKTVIIGPTGSHLRTVNVVTGVSGTTGTWATWNYVGSGPAGLFETVQVAVTRDNRFKSVAIPGFTGTATIDPSSGGGGGYDWVVVGDFKNGVYTVNGSPVAVTDMFQDDDTDGDAFHPEAIVPGVGYVGPESGDYGASLKGASLSAALPSATLYIEMDFTSDALAGSNGLSTLVYDGSDYAAGFTFAGGPNPNNSLIKNLFDNTTTTQTTSDIAFVVGLNKIAMTYTADHASVSINGSDVATLASSANFGDIARITPYFYVGMTMRVIKVGSPLADADLPALTALA